MAVASARAVVKYSVNGKDATRYWLVVSDSYAYKDSSDNISPSSVTATALKQEGGGNPAQDLDAWIEVRRNGSIVDSRQGSVTASVTATTTILEFSLYKNGVVCDKASVRVLAAGENGVSPDFPSFIFKQSASKPNAPQGTSSHPEGWVDAPDSSSGIWWMSYALVDGNNNAVIKGSWSEPIQATGNEGQQGMYTEFRYLKTSGGTPSLNPYANDPSVYGYTWSVNPPSMSRGDVMWMTKALKNPDGSLAPNPSNPAGAPLQWSSPARISGEDGAQGEQGEQGVNGVAYWLVAEPSVIAKDANGNLSASSVKVTAYKSDGASVGLATGCRYVYDGIISSGGWGTIETPVSGSISVPIRPTDTRVVVTLVSPGVSIGGTRPTLASVTIPIVREIKGDPGPAGLIWRKSEWRPDTEYHNDEALLGQQDYCYQDIVVVMKEDGTAEGVYVCKQTHISSEGNKPFATMGVNDEAYAYWKDANMMQPIYTPLLIADGACIAFMQGNRLRIYDTQGNLKAGVSAASGDYPIFYANPQRIPTAASAELSVMSSIGAMSMNVYDSASLSPSNSLTIPSGHYLHQDWAVIMSDNSVQRVKKLWQNTSGAAITLNAPLSMRFSATNSAAWSDEVGVNPTASPATTADKPFLWGNLYNATRNFGWFKLAEQAGSEDTSLSMFQVRDNGDTIMGNPVGARLQLTASPAAGLPRIDIYDTDGRPSATLDGTPISSASELYSSNNTSTQALSADTMTAQSVVEGGSLVTAEREIAFNATAEGVLTIPPFTLSLWGQSTEPPASAPTEFMQVSTHIKAIIYVDSMAVCALSTLIECNKTIPEARALVKAFAGASYSVGAGRHVVRMVVEHSGWQNGYAKAKLDRAVNISLAYGNLKCRYFANGLAIGSMTNNYCMIWNNGGSMNFVIENPSYGLKVTEDGIFVKKNGGAFVPANI